MLWVKDLGNRVSLSMRRLIKGIRTCNGATCQRNAEERATGQGRASGPVRRGILREVLRPVRDNENTTGHPVLSLPWIVHRDTERRINLTFSGMLALPVTGKIVTLPLLRTLLRFGIFLASILHRSQRFKRTQ